MNEAGELCPLICFSVFKGHSIRYVEMSIHYTLVYSMFYFKTFLLFKLTSRYHPNKKSKGHQKGKKEGYKYVFFLKCL